MTFNNQPLMSAACETPAIRFCADPVRSWPFKGSALPDLIFTSTRFDPNYFSSADFSRAKVVPSNSILRSVVKRQAEFLAGRICAREAMRYLGLTDSYPGVAMDRSPVWPFAVVGSISHTRGLAAAVVGGADNYLGLGLDCESILNPNQSESLAREILAAQEERVLVDQASAIATNVQLSLVFSLKESLFKAIYPSARRFFDFPDVNLRALDISDGSATLELMTTLTSQWHRGVKFKSSFKISDTEVLTMVSIQIRK